MVSFHFFKLWTLFTLSSRPLVVSFTAVSTTVNKNILRSQYRSKTSTTFALPSRKQQQTFLKQPTIFIKSLAMSTSSTVEQKERYSLADQEARFNKAKAENNLRFLDITSVYDPSYLKGKRIAITGANRGLGLALATEVTNAGAELIAIVRSSSPELEALQPKQIITGVDATNTEDTKELHTKVVNDGKPIDILINNAGYFKTEVEKLDTLDFDDEIKTIDICAIGPLRITSALINNNLLQEGSKVIMITSQGGSVSWRPTQCPEGGDYGHHVRVLTRIVYWKSFLSFSNIP
jgi:hypothetical protein